MTQFKASKYGVMFLILIWFAFPAVGMEDSQEDGVDVKANAPLAIEGQGLPPEMLDLIEQIRVEEQRKTAQFIGELARNNEIKLKELLAQLSEEKKKEIAEGFQKVKEELSAVIKEKPPTFKQQITTNKYIWGITTVTMVSVATSVFNSFDGIWSIPYVVVRSGIENLPLIINLYYVGKILSESGTIVGTLPSLVAKK